MADGEPEKCNTIQDGGTCCRSFRVSVAASSLVSVGET